MDRQPIRIPVPANVRWDAAIQKAVHESLPYHVPSFAQATFAADHVEVVSDSPHDHIEIAGRVQELIERVAKSFRDVRDRPLKRSEGEARIVPTDPYKVLLANRAVVPTGRGKFVYAKGFLDLFNAIDRLLEAYCIDRGASSERYPSTVQTQSLIDSGYLKASPHLAYFVAPAHLDAKALVRISESANPNQRFGPTECLGAPDQILSPTVCYHCFEARKRTAVGPELITALNQCHRHEVVNVESLERLTTYWMRELIVFGDEASVNSVLDDTLTFTTDLLERWGIWYEVTAASDPFFADLGTSQRLFQSAFELKRELRMPSFSGRSLAVASFNNHQKTLVEKFSISSTQKDGRRLTSGCIGWGYERLLYALYSQLGADHTRWPRHILDDLAI